jgi:hypothetical protein
MLIKRNLYGIVALCCLIVLNTYVKPEDETEDVITDIYFTDLNDFLVHTPFSLDIDKDSISDIRIIAASYTSSKYISDQ